MVDRQNQPTAWRRALESRRVTRDCAARVTRACHRLPRNALSPPPRRGTTLNWPRAEPTWVCAAVSPTVCRPGTRSDFSPVTSRR